MSMNEIQLLETACFSDDGYQVRNLLSRTDYTEYLGSSDGYMLLRNMLEKRFALLLQHQHEHEPVDIARCEQYGYQFSENSKFLIQHGAKVNDHNDRDLCSPLHLAVLTRDAEIVKILLSKGANVNATDYEGNTPLHLTFEVNTENIRVLLLENGADIKIRNSSDEAPFDICNESLENFYYFYKTKQFLDKGGNVEDKDIDDRTLLHKAVELKCQELVELLLDRGCNVNSVTKNGETPLHLASKNGYKHTILSLLQNGANINATTTKGDTPLHYAAKYCNYTYLRHIMKTLIENGANTKAENEFGLMPLNYAVKKGCSKAVKILLGDNPDPNDKHLKTAFCCFLAFNLDSVFGFDKNIRFISKLFLDLGFTISIEDFDNMIIPEKLYAKKLMHFTNAKFISSVQSLFNKQESLSPEERKRECLKYKILVSAVRFGFVDIFHNLLTPNVNVNATLSHGYTLLHHASENGHLTIVSELLSRGADVNAIVPLKEWSPLDFSVSKNFIDISRILLQNGANIHACDNKSESSLLWAVRFGSVDCIVLLLEAGANVNKLFTGNKCLLHDALFRNNINVAKCLLHYGACVNENDSFQIKPLFDILNSCIDTEAAEIVFNYGAKVFDFDLENCFTNEKFFKELQVKAVAANLEDFHISIDNEEISHYQTKCLEEIQGMKVMKIDECDITLHDLLIMPHRRVAIYMRNEKIVEFLDSLDFETTFPIFASKLTVCVKRGKLEKRLMELSYYCIEAITKIQLPYNVVSKMLSYLDTADMHRLIIASPIDLELKKSVQYKHRNTSSEANN